MLIKKMIKKLRFTGLGKFKVKGDIICFNQFNLGFS